MKKYYAIKNLRNEGYITESYLDFENIMKNSKSLRLLGKGFNSEIEAKKFIESPVYLKYKRFTAYTDASYDPKTNRCAYGYIIFDINGEIKYKYCNDSVDNTKLGSVMGELKAVMMTVKMARKLCVNMDINYDFNGIEILLNKKHKNTFINSYSQFMSENRYYYNLVRVNKRTKIIHKSVHNMVYKRLKIVSL